MFRRKKKDSLTKNILYEDFDAWYTNLKKCQGDEKNWELYKWIHNTLCILDAKCSSILQIDSIILVLLTVLYSVLFTTNIDGPYKMLIQFVLFIPLILLTWTILSLLRITYIYWNRAEDFLKIVGVLKQLYILRSQRSAIIRRAVIKSGLSLFIIVVILVIYIIITLNS